MGDDLGSAAGRARSGTQRRSRLARNPRCSQRSPPRRASGASTSSPGATSTTPRREAPSCTPTRSRWRWAAAGLDVTFRTSAVPGAPTALTRDGYRVLRRSGRYGSSPEQRGRASAWATVPATRWSRSGTACPSCRRSGTGGRASCSCTTSTPKCGAWCCRRRWRAWATSPSDASRRASTARAAS